MGETASDLVGVWHGRFSFPRLFGPVPFTAYVEQTADQLSGMIEEPGQRRANGRVLTSTISGSTNSGRVRFLKTYDGEIRGYGTVQYEGQITDEGREIHGAWSIPGNWSGSFIMIRARSLKQFAPRHREVVV